MDRMLDMLLYPDTEPSLYKEIRRRMSRMPLEAIWSIFRCFWGLRHGSARPEVGGAGEVYQWGPISNRYRGDPARVSGLRRSRAASYRTLSDAGMP
jgi:hypothetical protein